MFIKNGKWVILRADHGEGLKWKAISCTMKLISKTWMFDFMSFIKFTKWGKCEREIIIKIQTVPSF